MKRDEVISRIAHHRETLRRMGVASLALFGSTARDEATENSDVDMLIEFEGPVGLFALYGVEEFLEGILDTDKVDLVVRRAVIDELREGIYAEAVPCLGETGTITQDLKHLAPALRNVVDKA